MQLRHYQIRAVDDALSSVRGGARRICISAPTGAGKTIIAAELIRRHLADSWNCVCVYTHRRSLLCQLADYLARYGIDVGLVAAGKPATVAKCRVCMVHTVYRRSVVSRSMDAPRATLVIEDEAHLLQGRMMDCVRRLHPNAIFIGLTATPVFRTRRYDRIITAATKSELVSSGVLVPCKVYTVPARLRGLVRRSRQNTMLAELIPNKTHVYTQHIVGRCIDEWLRLNPDRRPTIGFAPGCAESLYLAQQFFAAGIPSAHIDHKAIWANGVTLPLDAEADLRKMLETGVVSIVWQRFKWREGIDVPSLGCAVLATVFSSVVSYLQALGRVMRSYGNKDHSIVIDHGSNLSKIGIHPNDDITWDGCRTDRQLMLANSRHHKRNKRHCACGWPITRDYVHCPVCGASFYCSRTNRIIEHQGQLVSQHCADIDVHAIWRRIVWRFGRAGRTWRQAAGYLYHTYGRWPDASFWPWPRDLADQKQPIRL